MAFAGGAGGQGAPAPAIRLNRVCFYPDGPKVAGVEDSKVRTFAVVALERGGIVLRGALGPATRWPASGETVRQADFSRLRKPGRYALVVAGVGRSYPFRVEPGVLREAARASIKAFYFQRASTTLDVRYAGAWARPAGHPDTAVLVHASAATTTRPAGSTISSPRGWYDAGDYNKYIVNSGISTYTLLFLLDQFPAYVAELETGIPESGDAIPDLLDEALWNLRWMRTMQDPADGGVYHKLTNAEFDSFESPAKGTAPRYVVEKSTAATLDFAAVMAHASLVARRYPRQLPGLADSLGAEAMRAWNWARKNPDHLYDQDALNQRFAPAISTGAYGDRHVGDEFSWAAAELYALTGADSFYVQAAPGVGDTLTVPSWASVGALGLYTLLDLRATLPRGTDTLALKQSLLQLAAPLLSRTRSSPYGVPIGGARDWVWGSNAVAANEGILLVQAYRLTGDTAYRNAAVAALDYLLGRNATGYSFLTGFGARSPRHPHHRPSASDTVAAPVPGLLVGGPNPGQQDKCDSYPSALPALSYSDAVCSYASNEIAINWNAPFAFLAVAVDAIFNDQHSPAASPIHPGKKRIRR